MLRPEVTEDVSGIFMVPFQLPGGRNVCCVHPRLHVCMHPHLHVCMCCVHHVSMCACVPASARVHLLCAPCLHVCVCVCTCVCTCACAVCTVSACVRVRVPASARGHVPCAPYLHVCVCCVHPRLHVCMCRVHPCLHVCCVYGVCTCIPVPCVCADGIQSHVCTLTCMYRLC